MGIVIGSKALGHPLGPLASVAVLAIVSCSSGSPQPDLDLVGSPATVSHIHGLAVDANGTLFAATHSGLLKQGSEGWLYASGDTSDHMGFSMHAADGVMYRSGHSFERPSLGVDSSTDGAAWTHLADVTDPPVDFHAMAVSYADSDTLWGWGYGVGLYRSSDGGTTWSSLEGEGIESQIYVLAGPNANDVVLAGTESGLHRSTDAGDTWTRLDDASTGWVTAIAADPSDPEHMMAFTPGGMRVTADGGRTWMLASQGLPAEGIAQVAISPVDGRTAFAATTDRIFMTDDDGRTWTRVSAD